MVWVHYREEGSAPKQGKRARQAKPTQSSRADEQTALKESGSRAHGEF